jgi:hypothetical protein
MEGKSRTGNGPLSAWTGARTDRASAQNGEGARRDDLTRALLRADRFRMTARLARQEEVVYFVGLVSAALVASGLIQLYFTSGERVSAGLQSENRPRQPRANRG